MSPQPSPRRRRHLRFLLLALSTCAALLALTLAWKLAGESLVEAGRSGRSPWLSRLFEPGSKLPAAKVHAKADLAFTGAMGVAFALLAALVLAYLTWHWRAPRLFKLGVWLGAYLVLELLVAPRLRAAWNLGEFYFVRFPDHRPEIVHPDFNADSLRATREPAEFRPETLNIVFLGDSFTYGAGVAAKQCLPYNLELRLRERYTEAGRPASEILVANFGWPSSSPLLSWRRLVEVGDHYQPDIVAMAVDMTDFLDDIKYAGMLERRGIFWWSDKVPVLLRLLKDFAPRGFERLKALLNPELPQQRFFASMAPLEETRESLLPLVESLDKIDAWCREREARFLVFLLPRNFQYSAEEAKLSWERKEYDPLGPYVLEPFRFFEQLEGTLPYPCFSLLPAFQQTDVSPTTLGWDPHWSPEGTLVAVEALLEMLAPEIETLLAGQD